QLSCNESLSLATLEAWAQGTPVLAHRRCEVLAGHLERGGGGWLADGYDEVAAALRALLEEPGQARERGGRGRPNLLKQYGSAEDFRRRLLDGLRQARRPLAEQLRQRGLERAALFDREAWQAGFGTLVERLLHGGPREVRDDLRVQPRGDRCTVATGT